MDIILALALLPAVIQAVLYYLSRYIWPKASKKLIFSVCFILNALGLYMLAFLAFIMDDDDMLAGFAGFFLGLAWTIGFAVMLLCVAGYWVYRRIKAKSQVRTEEEQG